MYALFYTCPQYGIYSTILLPIMEPSKARRSSILKPQKPRNNLADLEAEENATTRILTRRVSFAASNFIKEFAADPEKNTIWNTTYEEVVKSDSTQSSSENAQNTLANQQTQNSVHTSQVSISSNKTKSETKHVEIHLAGKSQDATANKKNVLQPSLPQSKNVKLCLNKTVDDVCDMEFTQIVPSNIKIEHNETVADLNRTDFKIFKPLLNSTTIHYNQDAKAIKNTSFYKRDILNDINFDEESMDITDVPLNESRIIVTKNAMPEDNDVSMEDVNSTKKECSNTRIFDNNSMEITERIPSGVSLAGDFKIYQDSGKKNFATKLNKTVFDGDMDLTEEESVGKIEENNYIVNKFNVPKENSSSENNKINKSVMKNINRTKNFNETVDFTENILVSQPIIQQTQFSQNFNRISNIQNMSSNFSNAKIPKLQLSKVDYTSMKEIVNASMDITENIPRQEFFEEYKDLQANANAGVAISQNISTTLSNSGIEKPCVMESESKNENVSGAITIQPIYKEHSSLQVLQCQQTLHNVSRQSNVENLPSAHPNAEIVEQVLPTDSHVTQNFTATVHTTPEVSSKEISRETQHLNVRQDLPMEVIEDVSTSQQIFAKSFGENIKQNVQELQQSTGPKDLLTCQNRSEKVEPNERDSLQTKIYNETLNFTQKIFQNMENFVTSTHGLQTPFNIQKSEQTKTYSENVEQTITMEFIQNITLGNFEISKTNIEARNETNFFESINITEPTPLIKDKVSSLLLQDKDVTTQFGDEIDDIREVTLDKTNFGSQNLEEVEQMKRNISFPKQITLEQFDRSGINENQSVRKENESELFEGRNITSSNISFPAPVNFNQFENTRPNKNQSSPIESEIKLSESINITESTPLKEEEYKQNDDVNIQKMALNKTDFALYNLEEVKTEEVENNSKHLIDTPNVFMGGEKFNQTNVMKSMKYNVSIPILVFDPMEDIKDAFYEEKKLIQNTEPIAALYNQRKPTANLCMTSLIQKPESVLVQNIEKLVNLNVSGHEKSLPLPDVSFPKLETIPSSSLLQQETNVQLSSGKLSPASLDSSNSNRNPNLETLNICTSPLSQQESNTIENHEFLKTSTNILNNSNSNLLELKIPSPIGQLKTSLTNLQNENVQNSQEKKELHQSLGSTYVTEREKNRKRISQESMDEVPSKKSFWSDSYKAMIKCESQLLLDNITPILCDSFDTIEIETILPIREPIIPSFKKEIPFRLGLDEFNACIETSISDMEKGDEIIEDINKRLKHQFSLPACNANFQTSAINFDELENCSFEDESDITSNDSLEESSIFCFGDKPSEEKILTIKEKIYEKESSCKNYCDIRCADDSKCELETLFGTIRLIVDFDHQSGQVKSIEVCDRLSDESEPSAVLSHKIFSHALSLKSIKAAVGEHYDILTLIDYIYGHMQKVIDFLCELDEFKGRFNLKMDSNFRTSFNIINLPLRILWCVTVDLSDMDNITENNVNVVAEVGSSLGENNIRTFLNNCPRGMQFLKAFIQNILSYIEVLKTRRRRN